MEENDPGQTINMPADPEAEIRKRIVELSKPDMIDLRSNLNAMILVLTDFLTLQTELMKRLMEKEVLTDEDVQAVYATTGDKEIVTQAYAAVYNRYASYFEKAREVIKQGDTMNEEGVATIEGLGGIKSTATD